jgi:hypothetical protein
MEKCPKCGHCPEKEEYEEEEGSEVELEVSDKDDILSELMDTITESLGKKLKK